MINLYFLEFLEVNEKKMFVYELICVLKRYDFNFNDIMD